MSDTCSSSDGDCYRLKETAEEYVAVLAAQEPMACPLGMGHQTDHVPGLVAHACDIAHRPVRVVDIGEHDLIVRPELRQRLGAAREIALEVIDGNRQFLSNLGG